MPQNLVVQGLRRLSPLEKYALNLVFHGTINPEELWVEIPEVYKIGGERVAGGGGGIGKIKLSRSSFADAEDLDMLTEVDDIDKTHPNNIKYLSTLVHEAGHYWQAKHKRHNTRRPYYQFSDRVLERANFVCKEQHASVGQVYFILKWQWDLEISKLNLTSESSGHKQVGPANRYSRIAVQDRDSDFRRYMSRREVGKFFPSRFDPYLADLKDSDAEEERWITHPMFIV